MYHADPGSNFWFAVVVLIIAIGAWAASSPRIGNYLSFPYPSSFLRSRACGLRIGWGLGLQCRLRLRRSEDAAPSCAYAAQHGGAKMPELLQTLSKGAVNEHLR
jgi:hypothetical protein